ncbi:MAG: tetratricopeptide (TPR) repeat protein [Colwellia sp.]
MSDVTQADKLVQKGHYAQAEKLYIQLLQRDARNGQAYRGLGKLALIANMPKRAVSLLQKACHLLTNEPLPFIYLADAFNRVGSEQYSLTVLEHGQKLFPTLAPMLYQLAQQQLMFGDLFNAEQSFRKVIEFGTDSIVSFALHDLTRLKYFTHEDEDLALIQSRLTGNRVDNKELILLNYAMGKAQDDMQDYAKAWQHFEQANALQLTQCSFKTIELTNFYRDVKSTITAKTLSKTRSIGIDEIVPIFILGLPRSGSTLLEQILSRHAEISGAGELPYLSREVNEYLFSQTQHHYPHSMLNLSDTQLNDAASIYLQNLSVHAEGKINVIDKLPANFQSIGLIYKLFPNAKVIHLQRHLPDVALSIYKNYFIENEPYFCSLEEFKQYNQHYIELMAHWRKVLPYFIYDLTYEQLIDNKEATLRALLNFCDIEWDPACLNETKVFHPVKTLSNVQVRKTMHKTLINPSQNYLQYLQLFLTDEL